jgi:cell division septation protein DedD
MDIALKQRLVGASVLIALAVVVLPMLFGGRPDPGETGSQRIEVPEQPPELDFETRRFPINTAPARAEPPPPDEPVSLPTPENSVAEISAAPAPRSEDRAAPDAGAQSLEEAQDTPPPGTEQAVAETAEQPVVVVAPDPLPQVAPVGRGRYVVQVASFSSADNARRLSGQLEGQGYAVIADQVKSDAGTLNRVRVGPFETEADADRAVAALQKQLPDIKPRVLDMEPGKAAAVTAPSDPLVRWVVQVGSFSNAANADNLVARLRLEGLSAYKESVSSGSSTVYRVRVGPFIERDEAISVDQRVNDRLGIDGVVMSAD